MLCAADAREDSAWRAAQVAKLQRACLSDPVRIEVASKHMTVDTLRQEYLFIPAKHKVGHAAHTRRSAPVCAWARQLGHTSWLLRDHICWLPAMCAVWSLVAGREPLTNPLPSWRAHRTAT